MRRRKHVELEEEGEDEINLIPYLDIVTNLVIFLVFSFQIIIEFRLINLIPPEITGGGSDAPAEPPKGLSAIVTKTSYSIMGVNVEFPPVDIPLNGGRHDIDKFHDELVRLKSEYGLGRGMMIIADGAVPYRTIVETMDAARDDGKGGDLFPDVKLARAGGTQ